MTHTDTHTHTYTQKVTVTVTQMNDDTHIAQLTAGQEAIRQLRCGIPDQKACQHERCSGLSGSERENGIVDEKVRR